MKMVLIILAILIVILLIYGFVLNYALKVEYYSVATSEKAGESVKIVMLADLHGMCFGDNNIRLIEKIKKEKPDMVCIAGDMTVKNGKGIESALHLCKKLTELCPVYYAPGNHEIRMEEYEKYILKLKKIGVFWLDNECKYMTLKGENIGIYGLNLDEYYYHKVWEKRDFSAKVIESALGTAGENQTHILLAHNPEYFESYCEWGADLILSGHVHGGIAKLPILGGVISPSLRLFPKYDSGIFRKGKSAMVLSRGLGTHHIRLRFFNTPEISVIKLS